jgi:hypothetical protein
MSEYRPQSPAGVQMYAGSRIASCSRVLFGVALVTLYACEALAGDAGNETLRAQPQELAPLPSARVDASPIPGPLFGPPYTSAAGPHAPSINSYTSMNGSFAPPELAETPSYSPKDFRPRGHSIFETDAGAPSGENLAFDKTIWERLDEYRSRDRVRVLTLWESGTGAVSLQTDHRWGPSLQWTSHLMNRGGATHGLLDRLVPVTHLTGGSASHVSTGHSSTPAPAKVPSVLMSSHPSAVP